MKKIKMSVAALSIALTMNAQDTVDYQRVTTLQDEVTFTRFEVIEMINTLEDILEWQEYDRERGETGMGKHSEGWGSNHWLTIMRDELYEKLHGNFEVNCMNCDEID